MEDQNSHYLNGRERQLFQPLGKGMKYVRNYVSSNRKVVVLIRDVLDKWKSGYYQNLK